MTVHSQRLFHLSWTNDHISSASRRSSGFAGLSVSSSFGLLSSFFEPSTQCWTAHAERALDVSHTRTFLIGGQDLFLLCWGISTLGLQHSAFTTIFTIILLATAGVVAVFDNILALTVPTLVNNPFGNHVHTILHITST